MTVHRLRLRPRPDHSDRVRPALNGVPLADALTTERAGEPELPLAVTRISPEARSAPRRPVERGTLLSRTARPRPAWARRYSKGL